MKQQRIIISLLLLATLSTGAQASSKVEAVKKELQTIKTEKSKINTETKKLESALENQKATVSQQASTNELTETRSAEVEEKVTNLQDLATVFQDPTQATTLYLKALYNGIDAPEKIGEIGVMIQEYEEGLVELEDLKQQLEEGKSNLSEEKTKKEELEKKLKEKQQKSDNLAKAIKEKEEKIKELTQQSFIDRLLKEAKSHIGTPYVWGGTTPSGFDCSGYTRYVFAQMGIYLPRTAREQQQVGTTVSKSAARPGDLIFRGNPAHHVGIYIGNGLYIHAPQTGENVKIATVKWSSITTVKRVIK